MKVSKDEILRVAELAEIGVPEEHVAGLVEDVQRIVDYVSSLAEVETDDDLPEHLPGPTSLRLREDQVHRTPLTRDPADMAPEFTEGFFVVPRLDAMESE